MGAVNCDEEQLLCQQYGIKGFPTVKLFGSAEATSIQGEYEKNPTDYQGARSAASVVRAVLDLLPDAVLRQSGEKGLEKIKAYPFYFLSYFPFVPFYHFLFSSFLLFLFFFFPFPFHLLFQFVKILFFFLIYNRTIANDNVVLLFSKKSTTPTLFRSLSLDFKYSAKFFLVEQNEEAIVKHFEVSNFPTVVVVPKEGAPVKYTGAVHYADLFAFLSSKLGKPKSGPFVVEGFKLRLPVSAKVTRVVSAKDFEDGCTSQHTVCFVAVLDPANDEYRQAGDEKLIDELSKKFAGRASFLWYAALEQPHVNTQFALNSGFPAMFALYPTRERYAVHVGKFDHGSLEEFVSNALAGAVRSNEFKTLPQFNTVRPEDFLQQPNAADDDDVSIDDIQLDDEPKKEL